MQQTDLWMIQNTLLEVSRCFPWGPRRGTLGVFLGRQREGKAGKGSFRRLFCWLLLQLPFICQRRAARITSIFTAVRCIQAPDTLQPGALPQASVNFTAAASTQPAFRGADIEERRQRMAESPFLPKYSN